MCRPPSGGRKILLVYHDHARPLEVNKALSVLHHRSQLLRLESLGHSIRTLEPHLTDRVTERLTLVRIWHYVVLNQPGQHRHRPDKGEMALAADLAQELL